MAEIHWLSAISGSFTNPADWSGGVVPGASDDAILDAVGATPYTVTASAIEMVDSLQTATNATLLMTRGFVGDAHGTGVGANAGAILIGPAATFVAGGEVSNSGLISVYGSAGTFVANGGVDNSGRISIGGAATFSAAGMVDNTGTVSIDGGASGATFHIVHVATLTGGGQIILGGGGFDELGSNGAAKFLNRDNTITGAGRLVGLVTNGSQGVIDATDPGGLTLSGSTLNNSGLLEATGGGVLTLSSTVLNDRNGDVLAAAGATVHVSGTLSGGALVAAGAGVVIASGAYLSVFTLAGTVRAAGLAIGGRLSNTGTIDMSGGLDAFRVYLGGGGVVNLDTNSSIGMLDGVGYFTNIDNTIAGGFQIGGGSFRFHFTNEAGGKIFATDTAGMNIGLTGDTITNAGTIECETAGGIHFGSSLQNSGTIIADQGTITIAGAVSGSGFIDLHRGTALIANSTFNEFVIFSGASGYVQLADSQTYGGAIVGFSKKGGTTLDLRDITLGGGTEALYSGGKAGGVLTVTDQIHTAHINMQGNFLTSTFNVASDGHGGVLVTATPGTASPEPIHALASPQHFASAMAGFGGAGPGEAYLESAWTPRTPLLSAPKAAVS